MRKTALIAFACCLTLFSCGRIEPAGTLGSEPAIYPDYAGVTVPCNIAPLNFSYLGDEPCAVLIDGMTIKAKDGLVSFPQAKWRKLMERDSISLTIAVNREGKWLSYAPFTIYVSKDEIDPYISYRLIPPGYQGWQTMGIYQRNLENYSRSAILTNDLTGGDCMNCHTYCNYDPSKMVFHVRAAFGGTMLINEGAIEKLNTKTDSTISALVYPYWHPSGDFIAFSVNKTLQAFYNHDPNRIEVYDLESDVVVYNVKTNEIAWSPLTKAEDRFETFPSFSPDGKWLYFCSAAAVSDMPKQHREARYGLYRIAFNPEDMSFGDELECVWDAPSEGYSLSFPRVSPDGRFLCITRHGYGNFSIWHRDADLWMIDLETGERFALGEANSSDVDSFHTWSSNGSWLVFSSRRGDDGLYTRPYFTHIGPDGRASKAFLLPEKDPRAYYKREINSFNLPAFMTGPVTFPKRAIVDEIRGSSGIDVGVAD